MGEKENKPFQLTFNGFLKVDFQRSRVTSDGGLILVRELDERLGSTTSAAPPSSGSKKANRRRTGHGCRAIASGRTKSACNSVCWPTTWVISGGG